jgi:hypothetical protein
LGSPPKSAHKGSLLSKEQEGASKGEKDHFRHLLSALQFSKERQGVFFNRGSTRVHKNSQKPGAQTLTGIKCPYCRGSVALDRIGMHFQKFCSAISTPMARETSMKKYNQFYTYLQSHSRGEITAEELQKEADNLFPSGTR